MLKDNVKYVMWTLLILISMFLLWYFRSIVFFVLISAILSLIVRPVYNVLRMHVLRSRKYAKPIAAVVTVLFVWTVVLGFFSFIVPFLIEEVQFLSRVDFDKLMDRFEGLSKSFVIPLEGSYIGDVGLPMIKNQINDFLVSLFDIERLRDLLSSFISFVGNTFLASFSVSFITFFLLKDEWLLLEAIKLFVPEIFYVGVDHMLWSINRLLRRYFVGIIIQISLMSLLVVCGLMIVGLEFHHALIIGLFTGIINIVPYLGPIIGASFGLLVSLVVYLQMLTPPDLFMFLGSVVLLFIVVQLIDNLIFQPFIFSSSVKAHPLEIFLVIIMAGYISGMVGMFLAIPVYTIIRVIAKEFFSKYNLVRKITGKMG